MRELRDSFAALFFAVAFVLIGSFALIQRVSAASALSRYDESAMSIDSKQLLDLINRQRTSHNLKPLTIDPRLNESAQFKASDMVNRNYFGHLDPDNDEKNGLNKAIGLEGTRCTSLNENIYWGRATNTPKGAVTWWMNSPPHRAAILDPSATVTGFGIDGNKYVEHFCTKY